MIGLKAIGTAAGLAFAGTAITAVVSPPRADDSTDAAPSTAPAALCDELVRAAKNQCLTGDKLASEREELAKERSHLQQMSAEIAESRHALQVETTRLEALVKQTGGHVEPAVAEKEKASAPEKEPVPAPEQPAKAAQAQEAKSPATHVDVVAKAMRGVKPEQAAAVIKKMDRDLAAKVLSEMRPADAAAIIGKLEPAEAAGLLTQAAHGDSQ